MSGLFSYIIYILIYIICMIYNVESLELCSTNTNNTTSNTRCQTVLLNGHKDLRILDIEEVNGSTISLQLNDNSMPNSSVECVLNNGTNELSLEIWVYSSQFVIFKVPELEMISNLECKINNDEYVSNGQIMISKLSKFTKHIHERTFSSNESNEQLIVTFSSCIIDEFFTPRSAFCLIDGNTKINATISNSTSITCDLSNISITKNNHTLIAVRTLELLNSTLSHQQPIFIPSSKYQYNTVISLQFNNQLTSVLVKVDHNLCNCPSSAPCDLFFDDISQFEYCLVANSSIEAILIPDSTLLIDNILKIRQIVNNQCHLSTDDLNLQPFIEVPIENATNSAIPSGKINQIQLKNQVQLIFKEDTGCGNRLCLCEWTILNSESDGSFSFNEGCSVYMDTLEMPINVHLNVCNFVGVCSTISQFNNEIITPFDIQIIGGSDQVFADETLSLYARLIFNQQLQDPTLIDYNQLKFKWYINNEVVSQLPVLTIMPGTYNPDEIITTTVNAQMNNSNTTTTSIKILRFINHPLVVLIESRSMSISVNEPLKLDASNSYDPNNQTTILQHNWKCIDLTDLSNQQDCQLNSALNNGILEVDGSSLIEGHRYILKDTISSVYSVKLQTQLNVSINVNGPNLPQIQFTKIPTSISSTGYLKVKAQIRPNDDYLKIEWIIIDKSSNITILDSSNFHKSVRSYEGLKSSKLLNVSFTLPPNKLRLNKNQLYTLKLVSTNQFGSSFADFEVKCLDFTTNSITSSNSNIFVSPSSHIYALSTPVQFTLMSNENKDLKIRFGLRTFGYTVKELWFIAKNTNKHQLFLPSTNTDNTVNSIQSKTCSKISQLQAIAEICQSNGGCFKVESIKFTVQSVSNTSGLMNQMKQLIEYDIKMGLPFDAYEKFNTLQLESCTKNYDLCDQIAEKLIQQLDIAGSNEMDELVGGMNYLSNILSENSCSDLILPDLLRSIGTIRTTMLHPKAVEIADHRHKRSTDILSAMAGSETGGITESVAGTLLIAYDLLVSKNQNVVTVYMSNLVDLLSGFCVQTDSTRTMIASGQNYTTIQLQGLIPSYKTFLSNEYSLAGTRGKTILFDKEFQRTYSNWQCTDTLNCSEICLGSAQVKFSALQVNDYMAAYFSTPAFSSIGLNQLVSDLYELVFMDPITGKQVMLNDGISFTVRIPLLSYRPSFYYKCFTFTGNAWASTYCRSSTYGISLNDSSITGLECTCNSGGFVGVFTVTAPNPQSYPQFNAINITMKLTTTGKCTPDNAKTFVQLISDASNLEKIRFQETACTTGGWLSTTLRPAFRSNQTSNSYAMQAIKKALLVPTGFNAYDSITVVNVTDTVIYRNLTNDGNARRVALRIDRSYKDLVGNDSYILTQSWLSTMSTNMRVSMYRFKAPTLVIGMQLNFTITVPFAGETIEQNKLSAEEISLWIQEQTVYDELDLRDPQNERMPIDTLNADEDIAELVVVTHVTSLMIILAAVVTVICILSSFCIGGLVFVKVRTDRLIERHNKNMQPLDVSHIPMTVLPFESQPLQVNVMNGEEEAHLDFASDTVVFGKRHGKN